MIICIIVDDERPARDLIALHLSHLKDFHLLAVFENAVDAFNYLQTNSVDLVFLDIQMPKISGIELIKSLKLPPKIILTTAYRDYAVEAFELDVLDYLVKPITQERFMKAISKFNYYSAKTPEPADPLPAFNEAYIFLKTGKEQAKIFLKDIIYIEGFRDYIKVHTTSRFCLANERLSYMEEKLPESKFVRIHKSFIIALDKLTSFTLDQVMLEKMALPIGRSYKNEFLKKTKAIALK
jgi:DNA-binding LytR/AlgR family response regulator